MSESDFLPEGCLGFDCDEVPGVIKEYVCFVCHSTLVGIDIPNSSLCMVICPEHGSIELCGRVTKSTVSIEMERGFLKFKEVVRNLDDLWPGLAEEGFEYYEAESIRKHFVCKRCNGRLVMQFISNDSVVVKLICSQCKSNIEKDGYIKRSKNAHSIAH